MRSFFRGLVPALLGLALLGLAGCQGESNEAALQQQAAQTANTAPVKAAPQPKSQQEYFQQQRQANPFSKSSGYPGTRR